MKISSRCEYACRAILELAINEHSERPLTAAAIAEKRNIPGKYLVHILIQLRRAGLVRSIRGPHGGYLLSKPPVDITLLDVVQAIDGPILNPLPVQDNAGKDLKPVWKHAARRIANVLQSYRVQDIIDRAHDADMYYI